MNHSNPLSARQSVLHANQANFLSKKWPILLVSIVNESTDKNVCLNF